MPEDVGGTPFSDGREPDDDHDHGVSDDEFASVVFDEDFVRAASVHEPTAVERLLAAAEARAEAAEAETRRAHARGEHGPLTDPVPGTGPHDPDDDLFDDDFDGHGPYAKQARWHRPVAWVLALVMGVGMVALAFAAVYRGAATGSGEQIRSPASTGAEQGGVVVPSVSAEDTPPAVSAIPRSP